MSDTDPGASGRNRGDGAVGARLRGRDAHFARRDHAAERAALAQLAHMTHAVAAEPASLQQAIADAVRALCGAESVVLAVRESGEDGETVRWCAVSGRLAGRAGSRWALHDCPCGAAVASAGPVLFERPGQAFKSIRASGLSVGEVLGIPWCVDGQPHGALAAVLLDGDGAHFDHDDLDLLEICAGFAAASHRLGQGADGGIERQVEARLRPVLEVKDALQREVDERRAAECALRESEARFRALADASPALVYQFDQDGRLIYLNQRCLADAPAGGEHGGAWRSIPRPADMDAYLREVFDGIRQGAFTRRIHARIADGGWRWFESHVAPWHAGGGEREAGQRGYVGIALDITGAVHAEESLKEADRRKDEFLATLAHELRNPLAPISNAVQLMRRPDGRRQSDRVIEMVGRQVRQMVRLVDDLMEVSRIARGKIDLKLERVPIAEIVHAAVETSQLMIERAGHQLTVSLPECALELEADRVRLTQVFANLLNNAAKYTDSGGRIWFDVGREGDQAVATVRDTGIGIPCDALARVFDMFAQVHRSVGRGQGGLGIGLTMVRSLVEMHHGTVDARSAGSGQGSEFIVRLPLAPVVEMDAGMQDSGQARPQAPFAGQRILVVDDNRDAADTLGLLLEADGAEVRVAYDGRAALALAESFKPGSILLDIGMPGMDGFEVARRLRQDERFAKLRIVALTGWGQDADRRQTRNRGFSSHLTKPVSVEDLQRVLG